MINIAENWKDIEGYEGLYAVSNLGNVKNTMKNQVLKLETVRRGYKAVYLQKNGHRKHCYVHILVANAFVPNPENCPLVNHKDENPANNSAENLEWCTYQYNNTYKDTHLKKALKQGYKVFQYDNTGNLVNTYNSTGEAARALKKSKGNIASCCGNKKFTAYGFAWSYFELTKEDVLKKFKNSQLFKVGIKNNSSSKTVLQFDKNMNFIASYPSTHEAGRQLSINPSRINGVCRGNRKSTHGFIFKYE